MHCQTTKLNYKHLLVQFDSIFIFTVLDSYQMPTSNVTVYTNLKTA